MFFQQENPTNNFCFNKIFLNILYVTNRAISCVTVVFYRILSVLIKFNVLVEFLCTPVLPYCFLTIGVGKGVGPGGGEGGEGPQ